MVALLLATAIAAVSIYDTRERSEQRDAQARATQARGAVQNAFGFASASLQGANGLLRPDFYIDRAGFKNYAEDIVRAGVFPRLTWIRTVPDRLRREFERDAGRPITAQTKDGKLEQRDRRGLYYPVTYIVPIDADHRRVIGFDHRSDAVRAHAANAAADEGEARMTRPIVQLVTNRPGVSLYEPVYQPGFPLRTVQERRVALRGFVSGGIALTELARRVRRQLPADTRVRVTDQGQVLFGPKKQDDPVGTTIDIAGRPWMVTVEARKSSPLLAALPIAGLGLVLIALVLLGASYAERRERALDAEREMAERDAEREALLVRVADALERELELDEKLDELARLVVPRVADACLVDVIEGRRLRRAGIGVVTPDLERALRAVPAPSDPDAVLVAASGDEPEPVAHLSELDQVGESMVVPLRGRSEPNGALVLAMSSAGGRTFSPDDIALTREIAVQLGLALDNARLFAQQREIAGTLQRALLPHGLPDPPGLDVAALYSPGLEGTEVGGDFYDVYPVGEAWLAVVGDVCGKGAEAAALTALARHTLRAVSELPTLEEMLSRLNVAIRDQTDDMTFATLALCRFAVAADGTGATATIAAAGHPAPLLVTADGTVEAVPAKGPFLGVLDAPKFELWEQHLTPGATILLYTDGVTEARRDSEQFGPDRLAELVRSMAGRPLSEVLARVEAAAIQFAGSGPQDDIAQLAVRVK